MPRLFKKDPERRKGLWRRVVDLALTDVRVLAGGMDQESLESLEERLLAADFGVAATLRLVDRVEDAARKGKVRGAQGLRDALRGEIRDILAQALPARLRGGPKRGFGIPLGSWLAAWPRARTILGETRDLPWSREVALTMLDELVQGRGVHRAPLLYHLIVLAIHIDGRRQPA